MDEVKVDKLVEVLTKARDERLDYLPEAGTLLEIIADAMNALQVAYIIISMSAPRDGLPPQEGEFVPVSNPKDTR